MFKSHFMWYLLLKDKVKVFLKMFANISTPVMQRLWEIMWSATSLVIDIIITSISFPIDSV